MKAWLAVASLATIACGPNLPAARTNPTSTAPHARTSQPSYEDDIDGDRVANDRCPCLAEDVDGFEDLDGCPDPDNDGDRLVDVCDACPNDPETYQGYQDEDGCPDLPRCFSDEPPPRVESLCPEGRPAPAEPFC